MTGRADERFLDEDDPLRDGHAAVGSPSGSGPIEEQEVTVLVRAEDLARARAASPDRTGA